MLLYRHLYKQIAGRTALRSRFTLTRQANAIAGINTRGHLHRQRLALLYPPLPVTGSTGIGNGFAPAATGGTGLLHLEEALLHAHLSGTATGTAGGGRATFPGTGAITSVTGRQAGNADFYRRTLDRVFQRNIQGVAQVRPALGSTAAATTAASTTKDIAEHVAKNIAEVAASKAAATHVGVDPGMAVLIVGTALFAVHQDIVSLSGLLEFLLGIGVVGIAVRVILHRLAAVSLLDFLFVRTLADAENLVIIAF